MKVKNAFFGGRFQPFHKGHLWTLKKVLGKCITLYVGIVHPNIKEKFPDGYPDSKLFVRV